MSGPPDSQARRTPGPEFVQELTAELRAGGFGAAAWRRFFSRAAARSRSALREHPARARSFLLWAGLGAGLGLEALLLGAGARPGAGWPGMGLRWAGWYAAATVLALLLLDMLEDEQGVAYQSLLLPNGLTFLRLGHAPLVAAALAAAGTHSLQARLLCGYLALVTATDFFDGILARVLGQTTRFGSLLDTLADTAFLVALATGLHQRGRISWLLLLLLWIRYPGALLGSIVLGLLRGPLSLRHTRIGRLTSFAVSILLLAAAVELIVSPSWLPRRWMRGSLDALAAVVAFNVAYFVYRGVKEGRRGRG